MAKRILTVVSVAITIIGLQAQSDPAIADVVGGVDGVTRDVVASPGEITGPDAVVNALPERSIARPGSAPAEAPERFDSTKTSAAIPSSEVLADLGDVERTNAVLGLEPFGEIEEGRLHQAGLVEQLWASGRFDEAIQGLEELEASGGAFAVSIAWKQPVPVDENRVYPDTPVSNRTDGSTARIDHHAPSGAILVLVVWDSGWSVNISTNGGQSFSETHYWSGYVAIADMSVSGDHAWIGYSADGDDFNSARFRRFFADTGAEDTTYDWQLVADENPNTIVELVVTGNAPDNNDRIYMAYLVDEIDTVKFWWDDLVGTTFSEIATGITNADRGLDLSWNPYNQTGHARWISYIGTDNWIKLYRSAGGGFELEILTEFTGVVHRTALTAYRDHIYCAFECQGDPGYTGICYLKNDDAGATNWLLDDAYWPTGDDVNGYAPDISVRSSLGRAVIFSSETGALDDVNFTTNRGWENSAWSEPEWMNSYDHLSGDETYLEWIGSGCVGSYGMLYFDEAGPQAPYFDLMTPRGFFCDGFESGNAGAWD